MKKLTIIWLRLSYKLCVLAPYLVEIGLTLSSTWAAIVLLTPPSNFATFPDSFRVADMLFSESQWGVVAIVGALLKAVGLIITYERRDWQNFAVLLRTVGLLISAVFWSYMGFSSMKGNSDTLFGFPGLLMGVTAWIVIIISPSIPRERE